MAVRGRKKAANGFDQRFVAALEFFRRQAAQKCAALVEDDRVNRRIQIEALHRNQAPDTR